MIHSRCLKIQFLSETQTINGVLSRPKGPREVLFCFFIVSGLPILCISARWRDASQMLHRQSSSALDMFFTMYSTMCCSCTCVLGIETCDTIIVACAGEHAPDGRDSNFLLGVTAGLFAIFAGPAFMFCIYLPFALLLWLFASLVGLFPTRQPLHEVRSRRQSPRSSRQESIRQPAPSTPALQRPIPLRVSSDPVPSSLEWHSQLQSRQGFIQQQIRSISRRQAEFERQHLPRPLNPPFAASSVPDGSTAGLSSTPAVNAASIGEVPYGGRNTSRPQSAMAAEDHIIDACVICMDAGKDWLCIPCGHLAMCGQCIAQVWAQTRRCPICKQPIRKVMQVYRA